MSILSTNPQILYREIHQKDPNHQYRSSTSGSLFTKPNMYGVDRSINGSGKAAKRDLKVSSSAFWPDVFKPSSVDMVPIKDCEQFDQILDKAKEISQPIVVDWMANWCRKCIYLKPKLEKLAADYDTKLKFYYVDVNNVPQALVKRGNVSKMPTIQVWKDGEMKAEVIGGHKAWLVIEEVREMISKFV